MTSNRPESDMERGLNNTLRGIKHLEVVTHRT
jgi:hypothetical protein